MFLWESYIRNAATRHDRFVYSEWEHDFLSLNSILFENFYSQIKQKFPMNAMHFWMSKLFRFEDIIYIYIYFVIEKKVMSSYVSFIMGNEKTFIHLCHFEHVLVWHSFSKYLILGMNLVSTCHIYELSLQWDGHDETRIEDIQVMYEV